MNLHVVPKLSLALFRFRGSQRGPVAFLLAIAVAITTAHDLAGVHDALALEAFQAPTIVVRHTRSFGGGVGGSDVGRGNTALQTLGLLLLQLAQCLLDGQGAEDVLGGGGQDGEDGEGAVFLILLETAAQTVRWSSARVLWRRRRLGAHFSRAMRSSLMRWRASESLPSRYWPAR